MIVSIQLLKSISQTATLSGSPSPGYVTNSLFGCALRETLDQGYD